MQKLKVIDLLNDKNMALSLLAGEKGLDREILIPRLQKPGLILAGHLEHLNPEKIQILGQTEISYIKSLGREKMQRIANDLMKHNICAFIVTKKLEPPAPFLKTAEKRGTAILGSEDRTSRLIKRLTSFLEKRLAPQTAVHGVLMNIQGVGVLILGKSGIGKSECALDLVSKGHRLVADDLIFLQKIGQDEVIGYGSDIIRHHMEVRGLGIISIKDLFGVVSVMDSSKVELVVELVEWKEPENIDRLGLDEHTCTILDKELSEYKIPVSPGRHLSVILEVAVRNYLLRKKGYNAPHFIDKTLQMKLEEEHQNKEEKQNS